MNHVDNLQLTLLCNDVYKQTKIEDERHLVNRGEVCRGLCLAPWLVLL